MLSPGVSQHLRFNGPRNDTIETPHFMHWRFADRGRRPVDCITSAAQDVSSPSWIHLYNDSSYRCESQQENFLTTRNFLTNDTIIIRSVIPHIVILLVCVSVRQTHGAIAAILVSEGDLHNPTGGSGLESIPTRRSNLHFAEVASISRASAMRPRHPAPNRRRPHCFTYRLGTLKVAASDCHQ